MLSQQSREIIIICGVGLGTALGCAVAAARKTVAFHKAVHWPSVPGTIVESWTRYQARGGGGSFRIRYAFAVGHEITGSGPRLSGSWFWTTRQMEKFVARYPVGREVEVFYDPENPGRNCLDRKDRGGLLPLWVGAVVAALCTALLICCSVAYS